MSDHREKWPKKDTSRSEDEKLDDALRDSFPASDPPAASEPSTIGTKRKEPTKPHH